MPVFAIANAPRTACYVIDHVQLLERGGALADFRIWGTIHKTAPGEFIVTVTAVPHPPGDLEGVKVIAHTSPSRDLAVEACADMVLQMGQLLRERGDRVVDVGAR